jgi:hypothetical protein
MCLSLFIQIFYLQNGKEKKSYLVRFFIVELNLVGIGTNANSTIMVTHFLHHEFDHSLKGLFPLSPTSYSNFIKCQEKVVEMGQSSFIVHSCLSL